MKKFVAIAALASLATVAFAQTPAPALGQPGSLVEVYGVIDLAVSSQINGSKNWNIGLTQGLFNGSRWGLRGSEDLGVANLKASYVFESGLMLPSGYLDQQGSGTAVGGSGFGQLFGRQAILAVSGDFGKVSFGRNYGLFSETIGAGDVFGTTHGNWSNANGSNYASDTGVNSFFQQESGQRWDNSIRYDGKIQNVTFGLNTAQSGWPNHIWYNTMYAGSIGYSDKDFPLSGSIGVQQELNDSATQTIEKHTNVGGGVKYALDPKNAIYAFYFHSAFNSGFTRIDPNNSELGGGATSLARTDDIASLAGNYYVSDNLNLIGAYYFDSGKKVATVSGKVKDGTSNRILVAADYYLTKNFDVYAAAAFSSFTDGFKYTKDGGDYDQDVGSLPQLGASNINPADGISSAVQLAIGSRFRF